MRIIVRTIYGSELQTAKQLGISHIIQPYASLQDALVDPLIVPFQPAVITQGMELTATYDDATDTELLSSQYFCIGNGGHRNVTGGVGGVPYTTPIPHKSSDSGLYSLIPFIVRPVSSDLTALEREKYRLRKTVMVDSTLYAAYYLRKLDITAAAPSSTLVTVVEGVATPSVFSPSINTLRPPVPPIGSANNGSYLQVTATVSVPFTATEVDELKSACALLFGDENMAIISEIGLCHGVDKPVTQVYPETGTQTPTSVLPGLYDTVGVQISCHISTYYPVVYTNNGFDFTLELGATEPLFGLNVS